MATRPTTPADWMELEVHALFAHDAIGDMTATNEHGGRAAPAVLVARHAAGTILRFRADVGPQARRELSGLAASLPPYAGAPLDDRALARICGPLEGAAPGHRGPSYRFPLPILPAIGAMQLYPAHSFMLHPALASWAADLQHRRPAFAVVRRGQAVCICACARLSREAAEAGVETAPEFRGQGAAVLATLAWAGAVRQSGRFPFYSTSWDNLASQAVARKLELVPVGELIHIDLRVPGSS